MLQLNFFFAPVLSVIPLTPTVFTNKISVSLKAIWQCSHRRTDFGHNFTSLQWTSWYFPGWSLSGSKNETSRLLTYRKVWWKKSYILKKLQENCFKKTFAFKILRFAEYQQLTKPCCGKKSMKWKTLHGMRYVNKKIVKNKTIQSMSRIFSCLS